MVHRVRMARGAPTHQENIRDDGVPGLEDDYKGNRVFTDTPVNPLMQTRPLPMYGGLLPLYGRHRRKGTGPLPGTFLHERRLEKR